MISDVDLADWLDSEYESPIPYEIIEEIAEICDIGTYRAQIGKFANIIGLLTLKFKPDVAEISTDYLNWNMLPEYSSLMPEFSLMPQFPSLYVKPKE